MIQKGKKILLQLVHFKGCSKEFARSFCVGVYIAFSPFIGFHTAMVFFFSWLFALNFVVLLGVSMLVNNPFTMIPIYGSGYVFGDWLLAYMPEQFFSLFDYFSIARDFFKKTMGISPSSIGAFLVGGNLLGILIAVILYPLIRYIKTCNTCIRC